MSEIHKCAPDGFRTSIARSFAAVDLKRAAALNHAIGASTARRRQPSSPFKANDRRKDAFWRRLANRLSGHL
jgi:hypothetical protein